MSNVNDSLIMGADALDAFERELAELGLASAAPADDDSAQVLAFDPSRPTVSQERAWMLHQQDPLAAAGPFVVCLRLRGKLDVPRLASAIRQLYQGDSALNFVFRLGRDGELEKVRQPMEHLSVEQISVASDQQAIDHLLGQLQQPLDLANGPIIRFTLMLRQADELLLGLHGHHILLDDSAWKPLFAALGQFYDAQPVPAAGVTASARPTGAVDEHQAARYWREAFTSGLHRTELPASFMLPQGQRVDIVDQGRSAAIGQPDGAVRVSTQVGCANLRRVSEQARASQFQTMAHLFGAYLAALLDLPHVDLLIPLVSQREVNGLADIASSSNVIALRVTPSPHDLAAGITQARDAILTGMHNNLPIEQVLAITGTRRSSVPNVVFTQFTDLAQHLHLTDVQVQTLAIPPLRSDYDISLAFKVVGRDELVLELTTGPRLSRTLGAFLLERFALLLASVDAGAALQLPRLLARAPGVVAGADGPVAVADGATLSQEQQRIAQIILDEFKAVLNLPELTLADHFFDVGGHSLLATRVIGKLQTHHGLSLGFAEFFESPTARELALHVKPAQAPREMRVVNSDNSRGMPPLSLLQQTYLEFSDFGRNPVFNIPYALRFDAAVDEQALQLAMVDLIERHQALRTLFVPDHAQGALQHVLPMEQVQAMQWFWPSTEQGSAHFRQVLADESVHSFDLTECLPLRVKLLRDEQGRQVLSLLIYHSAMDEWSTAIFMHELVQAYVQRSQGRAPQWHTLPAQFHQYAAQQDHAQILDEHMAHWTNTLGTLRKSPPLFQPAHERSDVQEVDYTGAFTDFALDASTASALNGLAKACNASLFHVIYAAITLSLYALGAGRKILVGTSVSGREDPTYQDTVGYFTNVVMHHTTLAEEQSVQALVRQVRDNIIAGLPYSDVPFALVEEAVRAPDEASRDTLFEVYLQFHAKNPLTGSFSQGDGQQVGFQLLDPDRSMAKFGLHFEVYEEPLSVSDAIRVVLSYRVSHYNEQQIALIRETTEHTLRVLAGLDGQQGNALRDVRRQLSCLVAHPGAALRHASGDIDPGFVPYPAQRASLYRELGYWQPENHGRFLANCRVRHGQNLALIQDDRQLTYAQLHGYALRFGGYLAGQGIKEGDFVLVQSPNVIEYFIVLFGLYHIGARPVFCLNGHGAYEIENIARASGAAGYIRIVEPGPDIKAAEAVIDALGQGNLALWFRQTLVSLGEVERSLPMLAGIGEDAVAPSQASAESIAFLQLSGGTTGLPKLIPRTHADYLYSVRLSAEVVQLGCDSRQLLVLPAAHNFAMSSPGSLGIFHAGGCVVLARDSSPRTCLGLIERHGVTDVSLVPAIASAWINSPLLEQHNLGSLRSIQIGGAKLLPVLAEQIMQRLGATLQQVYGMAEGLVNFTRLDDPGETLLHTQGRPLSPHDEVLIVDERDQSVAQGEAGQILTRGPYTINGYYNLPEVNRHSFTAEGFYKTGDVGYLDARGNIVVTGRIKEQINRAGEKITPSEIENFLLEHPDVRDVCVIGVDDPALGERIKAMIILQHPDRSLSLRDIRAFLMSRKLALFKMPDELELVTDFKYTHVGKIHKQQLKQGAKP